MGNLAKLYLTEVIRRECWDDMLVKGRGLVVRYHHHHIYLPISSSTTMSIIKNLYNQRAAR